MADRASAVLRWILIGTVAVSIVHYTDNTLRYDIYTGGKSTLVKDWMIPMSWVLFTGAGLAGYVALRQGRFSRAALLLAVCSVGGLIDPFHFTSVSPSDFDAYQLVFIWLDFVVGGLVMLAFAVWVAVARAPREAARTSRA